MKSPILYALAAVRFLTILPLRRGAEADGQYFAGSLFAFPLIGLAIGGLCAMVAVLLSPILPQPVLVLVEIVILAGISGCLHLDGLADSADGLLSSRKKEEKLVIMRDSRTGAMGVIAIVVVLLGKYAALTAASSSLLPVTLVLMPLAGRCALVFSMAILPYARSEGGLGALFYSRNTRLAAMISAIIMLTVLVTFVGISLLIWQSACAVGIALIGTVLLFSRWCRRSLAGATGDTLGAVCELTELMAAIAMTASFR
jgi:adenosylcobinamide-GDP ribazoletransferase